MSGFVPFAAPRPTAIAPGDAGVVAVGAAAVRRAPDHASELVNQLLFGETFRVRRRTGDGKWLLAESTDGYRGWIRGWSVVVGPRVRVAAWQRIARLAVSAPWWTGGGPAVGPLPRGARLARGARGGLLGPTGPLGGSARAPELRPRGRFARAAAPGRAAVRAARTWLGVPYLWGGRTPGGVDCSALVQVAAASAGVGLARDARLQCAQLGGVRGLLGFEQALAPEKSRHPKPGDLWFFGPHSRDVTHVAMSLGGIELIHAYGKVCMGSLDPGSPRFEPELFTSVLGWARLPGRGRSLKIA